MKGQRDQLSNTLPSCALLSSLDSTLPSPQSPKPAKKEQEGTHTIGKESGFPSRVSSKHLLRGVLLSVFRGALGFPFKALRVTDFLSSEVGGTWSLSVHTSEKRSPVFLESLSPA